MRELIMGGSKNIGSLTNKIRNNIEMFNYVCANVPYNKDMSIPEMVYYFVNDIKDIELCICGNKKKFMGFKNGYYKTCGSKACVIKSMKSTNIDNYGVDNPMRSDTIRDKARETIILKFGVDHPMKSEVVKDKHKKTMVERHGVEYAQQNKNIRSLSIESYNSNGDNNKISAKLRADKIKNKSIEEKKVIMDKKKDTIVENWGSVDNMYNHIVDKTRESSLEKYGTDHHLSNADIIRKRIETYMSNKVESIISEMPIDKSLVNRRMNENMTDYIFDINCNSCNNIFSINRQYFKSRIDNNEDICLICNPVTSGISKAEKEVLLYVRSIYNGEILENHKINNLELDIYLPDLKLGIEYNGLFYHSEYHKDKRYHVNKKTKFKDIGISLYQVWEDDWLYKRQIVESRISNLIGGNNRIGARKCVIKEVSSSDATKFLIESHIQGNVRSKVRIGLYYNNELVSLMSFGSLRISLGQKSIEGHYELLRFCNRLNTNVIGGASRLLKYFINEYKPLNVISYSDKSWSDGKIYKVLGFTFSHSSDPNYWWVDVKNCVRHNRFKFRKDVLVKMGHDPKMTEIQIMHSMKYLRLFDCGSDKWILNIN